jgi:hypothetical protein
MNRTNGGIVPGLLSAYFISETTERIILIKLGIEVYSRSCLVNLILCISVQYNPNFISNLNRKFISIVKTGATLVLSHIRLTADLHYFIFEMKYIVAL